MTALWSQKERKKAVDCSTAKTLIKKCFYLRPTLRKDKPVVANG